MIKSFSEPHIRPVLGTLVLIRQTLQLAAVTGVLAVAVPAAASTVYSYEKVEFQGLSAHEILLAQRAIEDTVPPPPPAPPVGETKAPAEARPPAAKSPGRAFLLNMLVPGAGHLYAGNKRGWIHLGLEGATWVTYLYYHDRGKTKEDEFETYADQHWDLVRWESSANYNPESDQLIKDFQQNNRQQYYEDIGKLPVYWTGWNDYSSSTNDADSRRFYRGMRNDSNNFLKNARYALVGGFVNRVVSAVDVLRILKNRASLGPDTQIKFNMRTRPFATENALRVTVSRRLY